MKLTLNRQAVAARAAPLAARTLEKVPAARKAAVAAVKPAARTVAKKTAAKMPEVPKVVTIGPVTIARAGAIVPAKTGRKRVAGAVAGGALLAYLLDPTMGRSRRSQIRQRAAGLVRRTRRKASGAGRAIVAEGYGVTQKVTHLREQPKTYNDETLKQKVQSEVLGGGETRDKLSISVDVANGVVTLRGTCEDPGSIERAVRKTQGVRDVVNLLHPPGTLAPNLDATTTR